MGIVVFLKENFAAQSKEAMLSSTWLQYIKIRGFLQYLFIVIFDEIIDY